MLVDDFRHRAEFLQRMTLDFINVVPDADWAFSPGPRFAPFCKQLRHVVCVRGAYNDAMVTHRADFSRKHEHSTGPLDRAALTSALIAKQQELLEILGGVNTHASIDFFGRAFSFGALTYTVVQHEALHHGQWSIYAALAGFNTPLSWQSEWGL